VRDSPSPSLSMEEAQMSSNHSSSVSSSPSHTERTAETTRTYSSVWSEHWKVALTHWHKHEIWFSIISNTGNDEFFTFCIFSPDSLHDGLSSSHSVLGHSPGIVQGPRETDVTSVEYNKENKRSHTDRGEYYWYMMQLCKDLKKKKKNYKI